MRNSKIQKTSFTFIPITASALPTPESKVPSIDFDVLSTTLLQRLQLMDTALSNEPYLAPKDLKGSDAEEHKAAYDNIKKYSKVNPLVKLNDEQKADSSQSRKNFLNPQSKEFIEFFENLKDCLNEAKKIEVVKKKKQTELDKKVVLGAVFNTVETVDHCIISLSLLKDSILKNLAELKGLEEQENKNIPEIEKEIERLQEENRRLRQEMENALTAFKANLFIKDKIKKLMFDSRESQEKCMKFLHNIKKCTEAFVSLRTCLRILNDAGFYNVNGRIVGFWSGTDAQKKANEAEDSLTDSNVPAISMMSYLGVILKLKNMSRELSDKVLLLISAEFAKQAIGTIPIYTSVSSRYEKPTFTVGNIHWNVELPILFLLMEMTEKGTKLQVHFYNHGTQTWSQPENLFENALSYALRRLSNVDMTPEENKKNRPVEERDGLPRKNLVLSRVDFSRSREYSLSSSPHSLSSSSLDVSTSSSRDVSPTPSPREVSPVLSSRDVSPVPPGFLEDEPLPILYQEMWKYITKRLKEKKPEKQQKATREVQSRAITWQKDSVSICLPMERTDQELNSVDLPTFSTPATPVVFNFELKGDGTVAMPSSIAESKQEEQKHVPDLPTSLTTAVRNNPVAGAVPTQNNAPVSQEGLFRKSRSEARNKIKQSFKFPSCSIL